MKKVRVSIVIPMFNAQFTIIRAIESVLAQDYDAEIEIIIVNDGSIDASEQIVKDYINSKGLNNIKLISQSNKGVSAARNTGINNAIGDYIALLDSDDEWLQGKLEAQMDVFFKYSSIYLLGTTYNNIIHKRNIFKQFDGLTSIAFKDQLLKNYFQPSTVIFRRELIEKIGLFPEDQKYAEEGNFFFKASYNYECALINRSYLNFGDGKRGFGHSGLSANLKEMQKGEIRNLKYVKDEKYISLLTYYLLRVFSTLKYVRRLLFQFYYRHN